MVIYFSGTGNSRYAAQSVANLTGDEAVSANDYLKSATLGDFASEKPYVFVAPTYAWRMPRLFSEFIEKSAFSGGKKAYFILTCGDAIGNAGAYAKKLCEKKDLAYMGTSALVMPENYIAMFKVPTESQAGRIIRAAEKDIREISTLISRGEPFSARTAGPVKFFESAAVNPAFYALFVSAKGFYATDKCTSCGLCAKLCPTNNITLRGKPSWSVSCTHCMACICACPVEAIEYKKASREKPRFFNREPALKNITKD